MKKLLFVFVLLLMPMMLFAGVKAEEEGKAVTFGANLDARINYSFDTNEASYYYGDSSLKFTFAPTDGYNTIYWELRPTGEEGIRIKRAYIDTDLAKALGLDCALSHRIGRQTVESYDYSFTDSGFELFEPSYTQNAAMATIAKGPFQARTAYIGSTDGIGLFEISAGFDEYLYHAELGLWKQKDSDIQAVSSLSAGGYGFTVGAGVLSDPDGHDAGAAVKYDFNNAYVAAAANTLDQWDFNAGYSHGKAGFDVSVYNDAEHTSVKPWVWVKVGNAKYRLVYDSYPQKITWRVNYAF